MAAVEKKILLISYHFPPSNAVGGMRIAHFAENLPTCGWTPLVLTVKDSGLSAVEHESANGWGGIKTIKAGKLPTFIEGYLKLKKMVLRLFKKKEDSRKETHPVKSSAVYPSASEKFFEKLKRYFISLFLTLPDAERNWVIPAVLKALLEVRREKVDYILTSCPPYSVHLIGLIVKGMTGVKWAADFRDPWMTTGSKRLYPTCALSIRIERYLEKKVVQKADLVLFNVERLRDAYKRQYKTEPESKFVFISNGFDPSFFSDLRPSKKYEKFTISYAGSFYLGRSPEPVFKALKALEREGRIGLQEVHVKLVGHCRQIGGEPVSRMIAAYGLEGVVAVSDPIPHPEALEMIRKSHLALLLAPDQPYQIPAKAYEYIGSGTEILALTEEGATADLIRSTRLGRSLSPSDVEGIKKYLVEMICSERLKTRDGAPHADEARSLVAKQFEGKAITQNLANNLNRTCALEEI